jgi:hypothetical protein
MISLLAFALVAGQINQNEAEMFGAPVDAGTGPTRPNEEELFGAPQPPAAAAEAQQRTDGGTNIDFEQLNAAALKSRFDTEEEKTNPLTIGGTLYLRTQASLLEHTEFKYQPLSAPGLVDIYLDARPNDRVRGVVVMRTLYDPTQGPNGPQSFVPTQLSTVSNPTTNPSFLLDQLYLKFDIVHRVFITAGRQKVKWGTSHIWNPTDALNSQKRDPLQPFDLRLGVNALKVHVPIESLGWNFYAYGLLDNNGPANQLGKLGGAARAEIVVPYLKAEVGLDGAWVSGKHPRYGIDISMPLPDPIPIDVYAEVSFRDASDFTLYRVNGSFDPNMPLMASVTSTVPTGITAQVSGGISTFIPYNDKNSLTLGLEYFYNPMGVDKPIYPLLFFTNQYTAFYAAQHYAGLFVTAAGLPNLTWVSLNLTGLMNITDLSALVRLDAFFRVLTFLQFEVFVAGNFGTRGGELKLQVDTPALQQTGPNSFGACPDPTGKAAGCIPPIYSPAPIGSAGVGLRISI